MATTRESKTPPLQRIRTMSIWTRIYPRLFQALLLIVLGLTCTAGLAAQSTLHVVEGVTESGEATDQWLAMLQKHMPPAQYRAIGPQPKPLGAAAKLWAELIRSRVASWEGEIPALAELFRPIAEPTRVLIVMGNRGVDDAFTHDATTIGFDLEALQKAYGDATLPENTERVDRLFRHEYVHLLQKAWWPAHPYGMDTPLRLALAEIWAEGLGNYFSMSARWRAKKGEPSETAKKTLATLEPRFVARISALACTSPEQAAKLTADLSRGRFDQKWGALSAALWLEAEASQSREALRNFVLAGPDGVWDLAERHLPDALQAVLKEARLAGSRCAEQ